MVIHEIKDGTLHLTVEGLDKIWAFKSQLSIPLTHIRGSASTPRSSMGGGTGCGCRGRRSRGSSRRGPSTRTASGCSGTSTIPRRR